MVRLGSTWGSADQDVTVHRRWCDALTDGSHLDEDGGFSNDVDDWVGASEEARSVRDALVRVISQVGGLLMLAQASGRLDLIDARLLERADATLREAEAMLHFVSELNGGPHRRRLETAAQFVGAALAEVRPLQNLATPLEMLTRAHRRLQGASGNCSEAAIRDGVGKRGCACGIMSGYGEFVGHGPT
jgi:hypothetical protein